MYSRELNLCIVLLNGCVRVSSCFIQSERLWRSAFYSLTRFHVVLFMQKDGKCPV
jgi:hypothetical protein